MEKLVLYNEIEVSWMEVESVASFIKNPLLKS